MKITLGQAEGKNVALDVDVLRRSHLLIWASTGGGKSWLIRRLVEQLFGKVPVIIVDREGEFATLREKYGFVLVGQGGETPADVRSAKLVAEKLLELRASAVCDLFELKQETRHEWVKAFIDGLVDAPKKLWGPTIIVIDEAHLFCPEKGQGESVAYGAVTDLAGQGRKRGFGIVLATQRLSKLSKNATAEMYNQAAGPTARQADRDRAAYEMGISDRKEIKEFSETLRRLECGNFFFQGRAISLDRVLVKVGPIETTHPEAGSTSYKAAPPPAPDKIKALLPKLADLPKAAEEKARTEAELRAEIRTLKATVRDLEKRPAQPAAVHSLKRETVDRARLELEVQREVDQVVRNCIRPAIEQAIGGNLELATEKLIELAKVIRQNRAILKDGPQWKMKFLSDQAKKGVAAAVVTGPAKVNVVQHSKVVQPPPKLPAPAPATVEPLPDGLKRADLKVLNRLAQVHDVLGTAHVSKEQLAAWSEYAPTGGGYGNILGKLRSAGLLEYRSAGVVAITDAGRALATPEPVALSNEEMLARALRVLGGKEALIFEVIYRAWPQDISREEVAGQTGYAVEGGGFGNYLGHMRALGFVTYPAKGSVRCADWLFID